ncbi:MAG: hypothetical protein R2773_07730 [Flavobacteriaceae bacterium]
MKQKDSITQLFENLKGTFDLEETPVGHEKRFMEKLHELHAKQSKPSRSWWKPLSIAATIALLLGVGFYSMDSKDSSMDLASVSPEMEKTQSFFLTTINQEIETLKSFENEESKALVDDALRRLQVLENDYITLEADLASSGNDQRVIAAMIANFQSRIEILQQVITTLEEIKTLKANKNETTI